MVISTDNGISKPSSRYEAKAIYIHFTLKPLQKVRESISSNHTHPTNSYG